ncbi:MAG: hemerythrin domain-containing protein [Pseudomonadota bacterium]
MTQEKKHADPWIQLIEDHQDVSEWFSNLDKLPNIKDKQEIWNHLSEIEAMFDRNLMLHFQFEEDHIFSRVLAHTTDLKLVKYVLSLQKDHGIITERITSFWKIVENNAETKSPDSSARLILLFMDIQDEILDHAHKEDQKLFPYVKENLELFENYDKE